MVTGVGTRRVNDCVAVCVGFEVDACTVKGELPDVVGVPDSEPDDERVMPGGRAPETTVHEGEGGPLATS